MRPLFVFLVIISSVVAIDISPLCDSSQYSSSLVVKSVKDFSSECFVPNYEYSVGFHFNTKMCPQFYPKHWRDFTAFLSDDNQYYYIYISLKCLKDEDTLPPSTNIIVFPDRSDHCSEYNTFSNRKYLFVLWLKEKKISGTAYKYRVEFTTSKGIKDEVFSLSKRTDRQLLLRDFVKKGVNISISPVNDITISDSYFIFCEWTVKPPGGQSRQCKPIEENYRIRCVCIDHATIPIILWYILIIWSLGTIVASQPAIDIIFESERVDKTVFSIFHNCNDRNFKFKYVIVIRLAKSRADFDLKDVTIDVEIFTLNNESIAPNFRFKARVMESRPITDIKLVMWRLTKMPEIKTIQCAHSGKPDGKICLLGIFKTCVIGEPPDVQEWYKVVKNISRSPRYFNLRRLPAEQEVADAEVRPIKGLAMTAISLSTLEVIVILFIDILFMCFISSLIPLKGIQSVSKQMLASIAMTTAFGTALNSIIVLLYKYLLLIDLMQRMKMHSRNEKISFIAIRVVYFFAFIMTIVFTGYVFTMRERDNGIVTFRWFVVIICSTALTALFWSVWSYWGNIFPSMKKPSEPSSLTVNSASINETTV